MKVSGPGSKLPPEAPGATDETQGQGAAFAEKVAGHGASEAAGATRSAGVMAAIGAELQAGRITPQIALDRVLEQVIDQQVGPSAPSGVRERVAAALRQALEDDPLLAEKLRTLAG
jgi:hypothetical protein